MTDFKAVEDNDRFQASTSDDGREHTLSIKEATLKENSEFMALVEDNEYGSFTTSALVTIKGNRFINSNNTNYHQIIFKCNNYITK